MNTFGKLVQIFRELVHIVVWKLVSRTPKQVSGNLGPLWQPGVCNDTKSNEKGFEEGLSEDNSERNYKQRRREKKHERSRGERAKGNTKDIDKTRFR